MRPVAWFLSALLIVALSIEKGEVARAQERFVPSVGRVRASVLRNRNEFILSAPRSRVAAIAARHGLTVIQPVDGHDHGVFLVSGPGRFGNRFDRIADADTPALQQLVGEVQGDADVARFEVNAAVVTPELAAGANLNETTAGVMDLLSDRTLVDYFGSQAWPYPSQLMLGFTAVADPSTPLRLDPAEIADARWWTRAEVRAAAAWDHPGDAPLKISPSSSIAYHLITTWLG